MKNNEKLLFKIKSTVYELSTIFILLAVVSFFAIANAILTGYNFVSSSNIATIINQASFLAVLGATQMLTILLGSINLSIGSVMAFSAILAGPLLVESSNVSPIFGPLVMIGIGAVIGLLNGLLVTKLKIPSFIATFGTMYIFRGAAWIIAGNTVYFRINESIRVLAQGRVFTIGDFNINMSVVVCVAVIVLLTLILRKTRFGHNVYFTGANPLAAKFSGIAVNRLIVTVFVIAGALSGFSGVLYTAKVNACDASMYMESHFDAVSVALISGASLLGGYGNMWGSAVGALIISSIKNGMNTLQVPSEYQTLVLGVLIILSVFFNDRLVKKKMGSTERISTNKTEAKAEAN